MCCSSVLEFWLGHTTFVSSGIPANQRKLGITGRKVTQRFFFNEFVSKLLFNSGPVSGQEACRNKLKEVSIITVKMSTSDSIVLRRETVGGIAWVTDMGGILSLYAGFSGISVFEIVFVLVRATWGRRNRK